MARILDSAQRGAAFIEMLDIAHESLGLRVGADEYSVALHDVLEIRRYEQPRTLSGAPSYMRGLIDFEGASVPVVDLRLRLGTAARYDTWTVVVLVNVAGATLGLVADAVVDVNEDALLANQTQRALDLRLLWSDVENFAQPRLAA